MIGSFTGDQNSTSAQTAMGQLLQDAQPMRAYRRGDVVTAAVMRVDSEGILVDIGHKSEGIILSREMRSLSPEALSKLKAGDEVFVYVLRPEGEEGPAMLSLDRASGERGWLILQKHLDSNTAVEGIIRGFNKGGAVVEVDGIQGFIPLSQLAPVNRTSGGASQEEVLAQRVGESIQVRLLELDRRRNRVILSERLALQQKRDQEKARLLQELREGEVRRGRVSGISDFGVFVDLGGADGLIHISELSWDSVQSPKEVVKLGDDLEVYVLKVDQANRKIALSLRRLQPEPWVTVADRYQVGQLVQGTITKLTNFGAFARLEGSVEGLIHISELTDRVIRHPKEVVQEGQVVSLRIIKIEPERRRLGLSLKQAEESWIGESQPLGGAEGTANAASGAYR